MPWGSPWASSLLELINLFITHRLFPSSRKSNGLAKRNSADKKRGKEKEERKKEETKRGRMSPLGEEVSLRKVSGGSEGYGSEEGLQVI